MQEFEYKIKVRINGDINEEDLIEFILYQLNTQASIFTDNPFIRKNEEKQQIYTDLFNF